MIQVNGNKTTLCACCATPRNFHAALSLCVVNLIPLFWKGLLQSVLFGSSFNSPRSRPCMETPLQPRRPCTGRTLRRQFPPPPEPDATTANSNQWLRDQLQQTTSLFLRGALLPLPLCQGKCSYCEWHMLMSGVVFMVV